jgi:hypothetical protein
MGHQGTDFHYRSCGLFFIWLRKNLNAFNPYLFWVIVTVMLFFRGIFCPKFDETNLETSLFFLITDSDDFHNKFLPASRNCPKEALKALTKMIEPSRKSFLYDFGP